jgi:regulator of protease activity HflC (stomatin/prohibitin superfamily)
MGSSLVTFLGIVIVLVLLGLRVVQQYQQGVVFRFGKIVGIKNPGLNWIVPFIDKIRLVDLRTITMPVPTQKIITKDNVSVDVSAVAYYKVVDPVKSIVAIENVMSAINQIAQTSIRNIVGKFQLDEILSERDAINKDITMVLDSHTESWGVLVPVVEIKDIELPEGMQRAMAKQAEAEREKRAKIIAAEGEFMASQKLADTADIMAAHPIALQLRNLQTMAEISVEKNSTIIFPAQFMNTVSDIQKYMNSEGLAKKV